MRTNVDSRVTYEVVYTNRGRLTDADGRVYGRARVFVLADRRVVTITPEGRRVYEAVYSEVRRRTQLLTVQTTEGVLALDTSGCGCGMGDVGNAPPEEGVPYRLVKVRAPEWHSAV